MEGGNAVHVPGAPHRSTDRAVGAEKGPEPTLGVRPLTCKWWELLRGWWQDRGARRRGGDKAVLCEVGRERVGDTFSPLRVMPYPRLPGPQERSRLERVTLESERLGLNPSCGFR